MTNRENYAIVWEKMLYGHVFSALRTNINCSAFQSTCMMGVYHWATRTTTRWATGNLSTLSSYHIVVTLPSGFRDRGMECDNSTRELRYTQITQITQSVEMSSGWWRIQFDCSWSGTDGQELQAGAETQSAGLMGEAMFYSLKQRGEKWEWEMLHYIQRLWYTLITCAVHILKTS